MIRCAIVALFALNVVGCVKHVEPGMAPSDFATYQTDDGWVGLVRHYEGDGPPLLVVHGMGANHYNWDYHPDVSPIDELVAEGWDVWVPELRGDPGTVGPNKGARKRFTFDDHGAHDLPAAVDVVLAQTGEDQLYWLGHSMGGMLLYTAMSDYPEKIAAGVAICSPGQFQNPNVHHKLAGSMGWVLAGKGAVHAKAGAKAVSWWGRGNPLYSKLGNKKNFDYGIAKGLARHALNDLPYPMAHQASRWINNGELTRLDGSPWVDFESQVPLLAMGAGMDRIVPEADVQGTCERFSDCEYISLSEKGGLSLDYGHVDPVLGKSAPEEVYPLFIDWLGERREEADAVGSAPSPVQ